MKVLIINSYAGSLTLGATALRQEIIGSYEDANFGLDIQKANFPWLNFKPYISAWPKQDLSETIVLAHPPCSAFSTLNTAKNTKGADSKAFDCTKKVLQYAMDNKAIAIAVESVTGALGGAWHIHQKYADDNGYYVYRILQTGAMFSCQWRERFWAVFVRKGAASPNLNISLTPRWRTVAETVAGVEDGPTFPGLERQLAALKKRFIEDAKCTPEEMSYIFDTQDPPHPTTGVNDILWKLKFPNEDRWEVCKKYVGTFSCGQMVFLNPDGLSPTLLGGSHWYLNGRNLSVDGFKRIGGFPDSYIFPSSPRNYYAGMRMYISKGVIPAVAEWVLSQLLTHVGEKHAQKVVYTACNCAYRYATDADVKHTCPVHGNPRRVAYEVEVAPNMIGDFRFRKKNWNTPGFLPRLRHEDHITTFERIQSKIAHEPMNEGEIACPIPEPTSTMSETSMPSSGSPA